MDLYIKDKTALVTGGTGGIGLAAAQALAAEGARVFITGRDSARLAEAVAAIGPQAQGILGDAATAAGAAAIIAALPKVDILVNNLGIYESRAFTDITDEGWMAMLETNVLSGVRLSRHYLPTMQAQNWGRIIFVSSESALATPEDMIHYATSKTAQLSVSRGLAQLTRGTGVTVNSVLPGPTRSAGIEAFLRSRSPHPEAPIAEVEAEFFASDRPSSILRRMIDADEVANLIAYLASPRSSATNGAALRVEGGLVNTIA